MKVTKYFKNIVLKKRSYIKVEWLDMVKSKYVKKELQNDGRIRYWLYIDELDKFLRVVFLSDNETIHNAFFDRNFKMNGGK